MQRRLYWDYMFTGVFSPRPLGGCPKKWSSPLALFIQSFALEASVRIHLDDRILKKKMQDHNFKYENESQKVVRTRQGNQAVMMILQVQ